MFQAEGWAAGVGTEYSRRAGKGRRPRVELLETRQLLSYVIKLDSLATSDGGSSFNVNYHFESHYDSPPYYPPSQPDLVLYWASGPSWSSRILDTDPKYPNTGGEAASGASTDSVSPFGAYSVDIPILKAKPAGATYLIALTAPPHHTPGQFDNQATLNNFISVSAAPNFTMTSATAPDSKDISFTYNVAQTALTAPFDVEVFRSPTPTFDRSTAVQVGLPIPISATASNGSSNLSVGPHKVIIPDADALHPDPYHEYVFVVAYLPNAQGTIDFSSTPPTYQETEFRKYVLGVLAHGFIANGDIASLPEWETTGANVMKNVLGYNQVISYNWLSTSNSPRQGVTIQEGQTLSSEILQAEHSLVGVNPNDVVDLDIVGHSRGTVVVTQALKNLQPFNDQAFKGGFKRLTLLDPHPANLNYAPQGDYSSGNFLLARLETRVYKAFSNSTLDPQVFIPKNVDEATNYYQNSSALMFSPFNQYSESLLNLWGEDSTLFQYEAGADKVPSVTLTNKVNGALGVIGHSEVPLYYVKQVLPLDAGKGYGSSAGPI